MNPRALRSVALLCVLSLPLLGVAVSTTGCNGSADDKSEAAEGAGTGAAAKSSAGEATKTGDVKPEAVVKTNSSDSIHARAANSSFQDKDVPGGTPISSAGATAKDAPVPPMNTGNEVTTPSGLQYLDLTVGTGKQPTRGQIVKLQIVGWLESGKQFRNTHSENKAYECQVGTGRGLLPGLEEAVASMKQGGKRRVRLIPKLGYGKVGSELQGVPKNATLIFELELLEVH